MHPCKPFLINVLSGLISGTPYTLLLYATSTYNRYLINVQCAQLKGYSLYCTTVRYIYSQSIPDQSAIFTHLGILSTLYYYTLQLPTIYTVYLINVQSSDLWGYSLHCTTIRYIFLQYIPDQNAHLCKRRLRPTK